MTQEEKAKRYDEAIERAKKWYNAPNVDKIPTFGNRVIEEIFPELPQQLELFKTPPKPTKQVTNTERRYDTTKYDPNTFHRIYEIKDDGEMEWVDSYSSKFSVQYAIEIFYCNKRHLNFFDVNNISKAKEVVKISKTMRSVILELDGHTYICSSKHGIPVMEGINGSKFDFKPFRPI